MNGNRPGGGRLYLCPTPIGNLEDITLRALRVLREVHVVAAEDTRHTRKLLAHYDIHTPLVSYHRHNEKERAEELVARMLEGQTVALVADAGTPGISDPGQRLVAAALAHGLPVEALPGPSAALTALVASGLPTDHFSFEGFLPRVRGKRREMLRALAGERRTMIFYEAPHRLRQTLADMLEAWGDRPCAVARELTKLHEEVWRGSLAGAVAVFGEREPQGEIVLVVAGLASPGTEAGHERAPDLQEEVKARLAQGVQRRQAMREVARAHGIPVREVYQALLKEKETR